MLWEYIIDDESFFVMTRWCPKLKCHVPVNGLPEKALNAKSIELIRIPSNIKAFKL